MLNKFVSKFDYLDFKKKLKHYFIDTAPIYANIELRLKEVQISLKNKLAVQVSIDDNNSVKENIQKIIKCCEQSLYPKMIEVSSQPVILSEERIKELLFQGLTLEQIHEKQIKKVWKRFIITRFNTAKNTIDYKEESNGKIFRAYFNRPLLTQRDAILNLAGGGQDGMIELYRLIIENSQIKELEEDASISTNNYRYK